MSIWLQGALLFACLRTVIFLRGPGLFFGPGRRLTYRAAHYRVRPISVTLSPRGQRKRGIYKRIIVNTSTRSHGIIINYCVGCMYRVDINVGASVDQQITTVSLHHSFSFRLRTPHTHPHCDLTCVYIVEVVSG